MSIVNSITENKSIIVNAFVTISASVITYIDQFNIVLRSLSGLIGIIVGILTIIKILKDLKRKRS